MEIHDIFAAITVVFSIFAVASAFWAMRRGLTYSAVSSVVVVLIFIGLSQVYHLIADMLELRSSLGGAVEYIEYILHTIAYIVFVWLMAKSMKAKLPA